MRQVYKGRIIELNIERVTLPNGHSFDLEVIHHPGGAAVVALDTERRVCLLRQYRHAARGWLWEIPAGKLNPAEPAHQTARRELQEEAGLAATEWLDLGRILSSPGVFTESIHLYLARELTQGRTATEEQELIEIHWLPLDTAVGWALSGKILDAKSIIGLLRAQAALDTADRPLGSNP